MISRTLLPLLALALMPAHAMAAANDPIPLKATVTFSKGGKTTSFSEHQFVEGKAIRAKNGKAVKLPGTGGASSKAFVGDTLVMKAKAKGDDMLLVLKMTSTDLEKAAVVRDGATSSTEMFAPRQTKTASKVVAQRVTGGWSYDVPEGPRTPQVSIRITR